MNKPRQMLEKVHNGSEASAYTASQLATALDVAAAYITRTIGPIAADETRLVRGQRARAWKFCTLPLNLQRKLNCAASDRGCRNVEHLVRTATGQPDPLALVPTRRQPAPRRPDDSLAEVVAEIRHLVEACPDPDKLSDGERQAILETACQWVLRLIGEGRTEKQANRRVVAVLRLHAPGLSRSADYLRRMFKRRLADWRATGQNMDALADHRKSNSGNLDGYQPPDADLELIGARAVFKCEGRVQSAWDEAVNQGELTAATVAHYGLEVGKWCEIPRKFRDALGADVQLFNTWRLGRRARSNATGYVIRSYDGIPSLACITADDFTMPVYFHVIEDGELVYFGRGQILLFMDFRSLRILGWAFLPASQYNAVAIYAECIRIFERYRVPDVLYFERNIWERSGLIKGRSGVAYTYPETRSGLARFGIQFIHAVRPRSKVIERIGGILQDHMAGTPGWCGRDMRRDCPEDTKRLIVQIERMADRQAAVALASENFLGFEEWQERFGQIVRDYNARPQRHGRILQGLSPDQAFAEFLDRRDPPRELDPRLRLLFAADPRREKVTVNGIILREGGRPYKYSGEALQRFWSAGEALAFFDPEEPDTILVSDLDRNPDSIVCVAREPEPSAIEDLINPGAGMLARCLRQNAGTTGHLAERFRRLKTVYRTLEPPCALPSRPVVTDAQTLELAERGQRKRDIVQARRRLREIESTSSARPEEVKGLRDFLEPTYTVPRMSFD